MSLNNILNTKINHVRRTGSINLGDAVNIHPFEVSKSVGGSFPTGDFEIDINGSSNLFLDIDAIDSTRLG